MEFRIFQHVCLQEETKERKVEFTIVIQAKIFYYYYQILRDTLPPCLNTIQWKFHR